VPEVVGQFEVVRVTPRSERNWWGTPPLGGKGFHLWVCVFCPCDPIASVSVSMAF
jgi:hypothetical protein